MTTYRYKHFDTPLHARYAAFFDLIGWHWSYKPATAHKDTPTFFILGHDPLNVLVGEGTTEAYLRDLRDTSRLDFAETNDILILGANPLLAPADFPNATCAPWAPVAGWLAEYTTDEELELQRQNDLTIGREPIEEDRFTWEPACWGGYGGHVGVYHTYLSYGLRPSGHHDGDHYCGHPPLIAAAWAEAADSLGREARVEQWPWPDDDVSFGGESH